MIDTDSEIEVPALLLGEATRQAPLKARAYVAGQLTRWGVTAQDDVLTVTSELVTNAYRYAGGPVTVRVTPKDSRFVAVEVWDTSPKEPVVLAPDVDAEGGRGMLMVACLADEWGLHHLEGGKVVWAWVPIGM